MVKKISVIIFMLLLFAGTTVFAGDTPEEIMLGKQRALFIGKITAINTDTYSIVPSTVMMGSIQQSEVQIKKFEKYSGTDDKPKVGDFIVAVLLDENKIENDWVFKSTTSDYKTLKLVSIKSGVITRYEKYINEGKYFEAQKKIDDKAKTSTAPTNASVQSKQPKEANTKVQSHTTNYIFIAAFAVLIACVIFITATTLKKRHNN